MKNALMFPYVVIVLFVSPGFAAIPQEPEQPASSQQQVSEQQTETSLIPPATNGATGKQEPEGSAVRNPYFSETQTPAENPTDTPPSAEPKQDLPVVHNGDALPAQAERMPIYITPYYNSEGPEINVGPFSEQLADANAETITALAETMKAQWQTLSVETMYVMAIRHYDLGLKDESVYWFYSAQFRAKVFRGALPPDTPGQIGSEDFERAHAHNSFHQLSGTYINGYAFGELDALQATVNRVVADNSNPPQLTDIYPNIEFIDSELWPEKVSLVVSGLEKMNEYISENGDEIKAQRKANGLEGKY